MKNIFVIDASVTLAWCLIDELSKTANQLLEKMSHHVMLVPSIWRYEVTNALCMADRRGRINIPQIQVFRALLAELPIEVEETRTMEPIFELAQKYKLSVYDAAYLELAIRRNGILVSFDKALRKAATLHAVSVEIQA